MSALQQENNYKIKNIGMFIVGVMFRNNRKIFDYKTNLPLNVGDKCIVESKNLEEFATIFSFKRNVLRGKLKRPLKNIIRKATEKDLARVVKNKGLEKEAGELFNEITKKKKLKIKFVCASFSFNSKKAVFTYTSDEGRVDIKDFVKELAEYFKIRIELKQVGMRDAARFLGVCGLCGRKLCCASFLKEFQPVSIKMAKDQEIPLSPMKISGICNRLLCCLVYEHDTYKELKKKIPKCGQCVSTKEGCGTVVKRDILKEQVTIRTDDDKYIKAKADELTILKKERPQKLQKKKQDKRQEGKKEIEEKPQEQPKKRNRGFRKGKDNRNRKRPERLEKSDKNEKQNRVPNKPKKSDKPDTPEKK